MRGRSERTPQTRARFLDALGRYGNVTDAAAEAGMARSGVYEWRQDDADFAAAWDDALQLGLAGLEDHAVKMAVAGSEKLTMFLLIANKPDKYQPRSTVDVNTSVNLAYRKQPLHELRRELAGLVALAANDPLLNGPTIEPEEDDKVVPFPTP